MSILAPILFIANNFVCEYLYPNHSELWDIFIPMEKTKYFYGDLFLYFGMFLCLFDFIDRFQWGVYELTIMDLVFTIPSSFIFSAILFAYVHKTRNIKPK